MKEFIDNHCHIFNIVDIPLYETIQGVFKFKITAAIYNVVPLETLKNIVDHFGKIIKFKNIKQKKMSS